MVDGADLMELYAKPDATIHEDLALINAWGRQPTHSLSIVTRDTKYIHWGYGDNGMSVTEELYDLKNDPLEMVNVIQADSTSSAELTESLATMRKKYDQHLAKWKAESVSYNFYKEYGVIFDRHLSWKERQQMYLQKAGNKKKAKAANKQTARAIHAAQPPIESVTELPQ